MHKIERHNFIMRQLQEYGSIVVSDACALLGCSDQTIRRDFQELEEQGKLKRVHGGAYIPSADDNGVPVKLREKLIVSEKRSMASAVISKLISEKDVIMLDSSTTCNALVKKIYSSGLKTTIITNSALIFEEPHPDGHNVDLICTGGLLNERLGSFEGSSTVQTICGYVADKAFISCNAISREFGILDKRNEQMEIRKAMLSHSRERYLMVDHTKFDDIANVFIADFREINGVITDCEPASEWKAFFDRLGIPVIW